MHFILLKGLEQGGLNFIIEDWFDLEKWMDAWWWISYSRSGWLQDLLADLLTIQFCCWTPWKALSKSKSKSNSKSEMFKPLKILWSASLFSYLVSLFGGKAVPQFHPLLTLAPALKENRDSCDRKVIKTAIFWNVMRQLIVVPHPGHGLSKRPPLNVHNCTIILCSLDVENMMINTEFLVKEKDHLAGE